MHFLTSPTAARALNVTGHRLMGLVCLDQITLLPKNRGGDYTWGPDHWEARHAAWVARRNGSRLWFAESSLTRGKSGE
jgi:hypothetical protein